MSKILFIIFVVFTLLGCQADENFIGRMEFQIPIKEENLAEILAHSEEIMPNSVYIGKDVKIKSDKAAPDLLYGTKISIDGRYSIVMAQRVGKPNLSLILYTAQSCGECVGWEKEGQRLKTVLTKYYGNKVITNLGPITYIPF